jgi:hypothetical protein
MGLLATAAANGQEGADQLMVQQAKTMGLQMPEGFQGIGPSAETRRFDIELEDRKDAKSRRAKMESELYTLELSFQSGRSDMDEHGMLLKKSQIAQRYGDYDAARSYINAANAMPDKGESKFETLEIIKQMEQTDDPEVIKILEDRLRKLRSSKDSAIITKKELLKRSLMDQGWEEAAADTKAAEIVAGNLKVSEFSGDVVSLSGRTPRKASAGPQITEEIIEGTELPPETGAIPAGVDPEAGTGPTGFFGNMWNRGLEAVGINPTAPAVDEAVLMYESLFARTVSTLATTMPGKDTNQVRDMLKPMAVRPKSLLQGDASALMRLKQTRDFLQAESNRLAQVAQSKSKVGKRIAAKATEDKTKVDLLLRDYNTIINATESKYPDIPEPAGEPLSDIELQEELDRLWLLKEEGSISDEEYSEDAQNLFLRQMQ